MLYEVITIGLLVDDAIVVVENVERLMSEEGLSPLEATRKSMDQITGALVGIGMVLSAVFVPMAFLSGSVGVIYRQFRITSYNVCYTKLLRSLKYSCSASPLMLANGSTQIATLSAPDLDPRLATPVRGVAGGAMPASTILSIASRTS